MSQQTRAIASRYNPWVVLLTASRGNIKRVLANPVFRKTVDDLLEASRFAQHKLHAEISGARAAKSINLAPRSGRHARRHRARSATEMN
jgi:hypothetical protein